MAIAKIYIPTLHTMQEKILQKSQAYRFNIFLCGRRFGKTMLIQYRISEAVRGKIIYLFAPEFDSVVETWNSAVTNYGAAAKHIDKTMRIMYFHGGGKFQIIGLHSKAQEDKGRGKDADIAIYEETQSIESSILEYHWNNVMRPTLADRKGDAWFIGTPPNSKSHYFAQLYCKGALNNHNALGADVPMHEHIKDGEEVSPNYMSFRKTAYDNPFIDNVELEEIRREMVPLVFEQEFLGYFVEYSKRPFVLAFDSKECEDRVFSREIAPNPALPFYISFDFNLSAMAATVWQKDPSNNLIICLAEFGCPPTEKVSVHYTTDLIRQWFFEKMGVKFGLWGGDVPIQPPSYLTIFVTGDATGTQADPRQRSGRNFYQTILRELGLEQRKGVLKTPSANPHHSNSWGQINTWLSMHQQIFISPKCTRLRRDMKLTQITEKKGIDKLAYDPHYFDTLRYFFNTFVPSKYNGEGRPNIKNVVK